VSDSERLSFTTQAAVPSDVQERRLADVADRIEAGELDSDLAAIETAMALLDGDIRQP
jgi:hypothetical protein